MAWTTRGMQQCTEVGVVGDDDPVVVYGVVQNLVVRCEAEVANRHCVVPLRCQQGGQTG